MSLRAPEFAPVLSLHLSRQVTADQDARVCQAVQQAMCTTDHCKVTHERRRTSRQLYPYPIQMVPVDDQLRPIGDEFVVLGKHLSDRGLDFYHREPLTCRRVVATLETGEGRNVSLLLDLSWCRFSKHGWYVNGGRFLQVVAQPQTNAA